MPCTAKRRCTGLGFATLGPKAGVAGGAGGLLKPPSKSSINNAQPSHAKLAEYGSIDPDYRVFATLRFRLMPDRRGANRAPGKQIPASG